MIPIGNEVLVDEYNTPYYGHDMRTMVNCNIANKIIGNQQEQWHINYSNEDLQDDLAGLEMEINKTRHEELKKLQANKDLLDHIAFLVKTGDMTEEDLFDAQDSVHEQLKYGNTTYYRWFDLSQFPLSFINGKEAGLFGPQNICTYLRKNFRVWYVCFQGDRIVVMGSNAVELDKCMAKLNEELRIAAGGEWIDQLTGTTQRYEKVLDRIDLEMSNINLIAETWNTTYEDAYDHLKKETDKELDAENALRLFALTGYMNMPTDPIL